MDTSLSYPSLKPNTEHIMSVIQELKEKNFTDNTLLSNLDFAERFIRSRPLNYYSKLLVKGKYSCVQIGQNTQQVITVTSENNETYVNICIHYQFNEKITKDLINDSHFHNHSCQDEIKSCFTQAREAVPVKGLSKIHIICNRFSITYTCKYAGMSLTVETKCQLKLEKLTAEGLLNKKVWLQKEKPTCHGLIACVHHLIKQYLKTGKILACSYRFVIHGDKELIIITSGEKDEKEYVLLHDQDGVSMFPPSFCETELKSSDNGLCLMN